MNRQVLYRVKNFDKRVVVDPLIEGIDGESILHIRDDQHVRIDVVKHWSGALLRIIRVCAGKLP